MSYSTIYGFSFSAASRNDIIICGWSSMLIATFLMTSVWNIIQHFHIGIIWHGLGNFLSDCQWYLVKNYFGHNVVNSILPIREKIVLHMYMHHGSTRDKSMSKTWPISNPVKPDCLLKHSESLHNFYLSASPILNLNVQYLTSKFGKQG